MRRWRRLLPVCAIRHLPDRGVCLAGRHGPYGRRGAARLCARLSPQAAQADRPPHAPHASEEHPRSAEGADGTQAGAAPQGKRVKRVRGAGGHQRGPAGPVAEDPADQSGAKESALKEEEEEGGGRRTGESGAELCNDAG